MALLSKRYLRTDQAITVIGLGKVGTAIAAVALENQFRVFGFDVNEEVIESLAKRQYRTQEPLVDSMLRKFHRNFDVKASLQDAIKVSEISVVIVPTPSMEDGNFSSQAVETAVKRIIDAINLQIELSNLDLKNYRHSLIIASTLSPETMRKKILPLKQKLNINLQDKVEFIYSPEFIALGSIVNNLRNPEYIILGHSGEGVSRKVIDYKKKVNRNIAAIHITSFESAEIAKISINTFLTTKISYANMLGNLVAETPNASQAEVFGIMKDDSRIGKKFFSPGLGYGGPCLPRDNRALIAFGATKKLDVPLASATDAVNENQPSLISRQIMQFIGDKKRILILGITYKAGTNSVEESHALRVIKKLKLSVDHFEIHDFYYNFDESSECAEYNSSNGEIPQIYPDGVICFLNDQRYLEYLEQLPEKMILRVYDLSVDSFS
jgi:UDPglucose 6-dehydrogenase